MQLFSNLLNIKSNAEKINHIKLEQIKKLLSNDINLVYYDFKINIFITFEPQIKVRYDKSQDYSNDNIILYKFDKHFNLDCLGLINRGIGNYGLAYHVYRYNRFKHDLNNDNFYYSFTSATNIFAALIITGVITKENIDTDTDKLLASWDRCTVLEKLINGGN